MDPQLRIDIFKSFEPICLYADIPLVLFVQGKSNFNTVGDLLDFARKNPGKLNAGSAGIG